MVCGGEGLVKGEVQHGVGGRGWLGGKFQLWFPTLRLVALG